MNERWKKGRKDHKKEGKQKKERREREKKRERKNEQEKDQDLVSSGLNKVVTGRDSRVVHKIYSPTLIHDHNNDK